MTPDLPPDAEQAAVRPPSRRAFFAGGAVLAAGAVLTACGSGSAEQIPVTGSAPPAPDAATTTVPGSPEMDITWMRTAQSIELLAAQVCADALETGHLEGDAEELVRRFEPIYREHAEVLGDTVRSLGAAEVTEPNQYLLEGEIATLFQDVSDQETALQAVLRAANIATATLVKAAGQLTTPELRSTAMSVAGSDARQIALLHDELDMVIVPTPFFRTAAAAPKLALIES